MRFDETPLLWLEEKWGKSARAMSELTGFAWHVDHIVPRNSPIVCGLEVECNYRVIPASLNQSKGNRYWPTMSVEEVREAIEFYKARGDI